MSESLETSPDENVNLVTENPIAFVRELKSREGKDIWLCGGRALAASLLPEIDDMMLKVNPFLMGTGISLISSTLPKIKLEMQTRTIYDNGFMLLHYVVQH